MLLALEADEDAALGEDELVLALKDALEAFLIEVYASKLIDDLVDRLDQLYSLLKMVGLVYFLREEADYKIGVCAGQCNHEIDNGFGVKVVEHKDDMYDFFGLFVVLRGDLAEGFIGHHHQRHKLQDLKGQRR